MQQNPVGWFEIYVDDLPRAKAFYETVLGVKLQKLDSPTEEIEMWAFPMSMEGTGAAGAIAKMRDGNPKGNATLVYFTCQDCAVEAARVPGAGGQIMKDKFSIGQYGNIAIVTDPNGNAFGLHSMK